MSMTDLSASEVEQVFANAMRLHQTGQLQQAERLYEQVLTADPRHFDGLNLIGVIALQTDRNARAAEFFSRAIAISDQVADVHNNIGEAHRRLGRTDLALVHFGKAAGLDPTFTDARQNFARMLMASGRPDEALVELRNVLSTEPNNPQAKTFVADVFAARGQTQEAARLYQEIMSSVPAFMPAQIGLGRLMLAQGDADAALPLATRALGVEPTAEAKSLFVHAVAAARNVPNVPEIRRFLAIALVDAWARPTILAAAATSLVRETPVIANAIARITAPGQKELNSADLFGAFGLTVIAKDELFRALLETAPVCDGDLERLLGTIRFLLLHRESQAASADPDLMRFYCAMARQNFINGYVFATTQVERDALAQAKTVLTTAIKNETTPDPLLPVVIAAYEPLHGIAGADALARRPMAPPMIPLFSQQISEPMLEQELAISIAELTEIEDDVSLEVQRQYEENPYPTWVKADLSAAPISFDERMRRLMPLSDFKPLNKAAPDILIAGCGTGQHSIETAQVHPDAKVLAVDLSLASLAYALRKSREAGVRNVSYAQADILKLGGIGRSFDVIESSGVLHHLRDPELGWRTLLSLLRPGGAMRIGLYSRLARDHVRAARDFIKRGGYQPTLDGIRACRQAVLASTDASLQWVARSPDFFTTSSCRDLLFHVQEHQFTLPQIEAFLSANSLMLLGFENLPAAVIASYRQKFPDDPAMTNLGHWHTFETENPHLFGGMYQFWIQKPAQSQ